MEHEQKLPLTSLGSFYHEEFRKLHSTVSIPARIFSGAIDSLPIVIGAPRGGVDVYVAPVETERLRLQHVDDVAVENSNAADLRNIKR